MPDSRFQLAPFQGRAVFLSAADRGAPHSGAGAGGRSRASPHLLIQMRAGMFRVVCKKGLVCGDTLAGVRVPHKSDVAAHVIEGAYEVLHGLDWAQESCDAMQAVMLAVAVNPSSSATGVSVSIRAEIFQQSSIRLAKSGSSAMQFSPWP